MKLYRAVRTGDYDEPIEAVIAADTAVDAREALEGFLPNTPAESWKLEAIRLGTRAKVLLVQTIDG